MKPDARPSRTPNRTGGRPDAQSEVRTIGAELRARRDQLGWALPDIANWLRIRLPYLEALEEGRVGDLPGTAYAIGFLKTYAAALGFDAEEMAQRFGRESGGALNRKPDLTFPAPEPERTIPVSVRVAAGLVVIVCAYVVWFRTTGHQIVPSERVPSVAEVMPGVTAHGTASPQVASVLPGPGHAPPPRSPAAPPVTLPASPSQNEQARAPASGNPVGSTGAVANAPAQAAPSPGDAAPVIPLQALPASRGAGAPAPAPGEVASPAAPISGGPATVSPPGSASGISPSPSGATPAVSGESAAPSSVLPAAPGLGTSSAAEPPADTAPPVPQNLPVVHVSADSWVSIRDAQGHMLVQRVLKAGEVWAPPADSSPDAVYRMTVGNAGGISLSVGTASTGPLGRNGAVLRSLSVSADAIRSGHVVAAPAHAAVSSSHTVPEAAPAAAGPQPAE